MTEDTDCVRTVLSAATAREDSRRVFRVVVSGRVLGAGSNMGCYLEDYRARVGTWAARIVWRAQGRNINGQVRSDLAKRCLCAAVLAIILVIGGVEQNTGPGVVGESFMQVNCSACERILKSGTVRDVGTLVS